MWKFILFVVVIAIASPIIWRVVNFFIKCHLESKAKDIFKRLQEVYDHAKRSRVSKEEIDIFRQLADQCLTIINSRTDDGWGKSFRGVPSMRNKVQQMSLFVCGQPVHVSPAVSDEIEKLAALRKEGMISDHEFQAFSERFNLSTGEKARDIIGAIAKLHEQYAAGAMSQGNYHAGLWSLLDKLDRKT